MDSSTALRQAIASVAVPGAPPRQNAVGAAIGLSFLDSALRLNHIQRLSETLTVTDHRTARRTTEIDVSLAMLDEGQRRAAALSRELRSASRAGGPDHPVPDEVWVPVARIDRRSTAPVTIWDTSGARMPRLTQQECGRLLAAGLFRLLRGILDSLPGAAADSDLHLLLHRVPEAEWLLQHAIDVLGTERHRPPAEPPRPRATGVVAGQGARYRAIALAVLDKHEDALTEFFELLDVALDNDLLIVALDPSRDEHLLTSCRSSGRSVCWRSGTGSPSTPTGPGNELAFLHLQLAVGGSSRARLAAVNAGIAGLRATDGGLAEVLPHLVQALLPAETYVPPAREHLERLVGRAGDYQVVAGPALPVVPDGDARRIPIWISWQMRRSEEGLRVPLLALHRAVDRLGLAAAECTGQRSGALSIEYLVCRRTGVSVLRGRGKMAVAKSLVEGRSRDFRNCPAQLSADLEAAWRAELHAAGHHDLVSDLSVSPREFLLGGH